MPVKMEPHVLAFWQELLAPFDDHQLSTTRRGGKDLTYVCKRALTNRVDSVCGPDGWDVEYKATARGYTARVGINCPQNDGTWRWLYKEDGAGFEEMGQVNKTTNEFEYDVDNDEKSGYTNALRRALQDAWGCGRYLYKKGIPTFLDPNAGSPSTVTAAPPQAARQAPAQAPAPVAQAPAQAPPAATQPPKQYDNFKFPKPGKSVFAWAKEMERTFETTLVAGMGKDGEKLGVGSKFDSWDEAAVSAICAKIINYITTLPTYKGQFDELIGTFNANAAAAAATVAAPTILADPSGISALRKGLVAKMKELCEKQTGGTPDAAQLKKIFTAIAGNAANGHGHKGEVPDSLSSMTDATWLHNMTALVDAQLAQPAPVVEDDDDIPF